MLPVNEPDEEVKARAIIYLPHQTNEVRSRSEQAVLNLVLSRNAEEHCHKRKFQSLSQMWSTQSPSFGLSRGACFLALRERRHATGTWRSFRILLFRPGKRFEQL